MEDLLFFVSLAVLVGIYLVLQAETRRNPFAAPETLVTRGGGTKIPPDPEGRNAWTQRRGG